MMNDYWHGFCKGSCRNAALPKHRTLWAASLWQCRCAEFVKQCRHLWKNTILERVKPRFSCCLYSLLILSWKSRVTLEYLRLGLNISLLYAWRICSICTVHSYFPDLSLSTEKQACYCFRSLSRKGVVWWVLQNKAYCSSSRYLYEMHPMGIHIPSGISFWDRVWQVITFNCY